jgi:serine/threonine-protein kinase
MWPVLVGTVAIATLTVVLWPAPQAVPTPDETPPSPVNSQAPPIEPTPPTPAPARVQPEPAAAEPAAAPAPATSRKRARGKLSVNVLPYAEVKLDGAPLGRTPMRELVDAGRHTLELYNPDVPLRTRKVVQIAAGGELSVTQW